VRLSRRAPTRISRARVHRVPDRPAEPIEDQPRRRPSIAAPLRLSPRSSGRTTKASWARSRRLDDDGLGNSELRRGRTREDALAARSQPDQPTRACALAFLLTQKRHLRGSSLVCEGSYLAITAQLRPAPMSHMLTLAGLRKDEDITIEACRQFSPRYRPAKVRRACWAGAFGNLLSPHDCQAAVAALAAAARPVVDDLLVAYDATVPIKFASVAIVAALLGCERPPLSSYDRLC
jgi:hypothetical protein